MSPGRPTETAVAIALGANLGDRAATLRAAVKGIAPYVTVTRASAIYETMPAYVTDQPPFLNAAVYGTTTLSPLALLWSLKHIEDELGRKPSFRNGPRLIDLDILFYGDRVIQEADLVVPHPRLIEREFALRPLFDVAPQWQHPVTRLSVEAMLSNLTDQTAIRLEDLSPS